MGFVLSADALWFPHCRASASHLRMRRVGANRAFS